MKTRLFFAWFDLWVGAYWDRRARILYVCPLPMVGVAFGPRRRCFPPVRLLERRGVATTLAILFGVFVGGVIVAAFVLWTGAVLGLLGL